ncbi:MAG: endonuclease/exonuclease/phosphatase family protein [Myxococcales bacterium]|jgi:endonuclease/exonuclease/phosphatase family metal-dependent hydrolase|nr:endonuclease/exonuclease/phosphatase family protein [Myxococcales bacterium]
METFRVATLNVWNRFGPWEERLPVLRRALAALAPDVLGMQEVLVLPDGSFDQLALIGEGLGYHAVWGRSPEPDGWPVGNAFLSRWPIARSETLALPDNGTGERRCVLFAELDAPFAKVPCFVTHLNWKLDDGAARALQVKRLVEIVRDLAPAHGFPPLVMGDFNAEPDADEIRYLRGLTGLGGPCVYFADCFAAAAPPGRDGTTFARRNPFALLCREPNRRIDYVFVRGPDDRGRGEPLEADVCFDRAEGDIFPSDHFGVIATLRC